MLMHCHIVPKILFLLIAGFLSNNLSAKDRYYRRLTPGAFKRFSDVARVGSGKYGTLYRVGSATGHAMEQHQFVLERPADKNRHNYYLFNDDATLLNDSTLRFNKAGGFVFENGSWIHEGGQWVYADFYSDRTGSGVRFNTDTSSGISIPPDLGKGIYIYEGGELKMVTSDQSEETFSDLKKDGLYFLPNPGFLYFDLLLSRVE